MILDTVLQTNSFAVTAQQLGMTQSAITKAVQELERFFDAKLFERNNRGVKATELGACMGSHVRAILAEVRHMTNDLNALRLGEAGHVVIGSLATATSRVLPDSVSRLRQEHPNIHISILVGDRSQLYNYLIDGKIDIVIGSIPQEPQREYERVRHQTLYEDRLCIMAGLNHPLVGRSQVRLADVVDFPWIIPPAESLIRREIDRLFAREQLPLPYNLIESLSPISNIVLLKDQRSLTFMSQGLARIFMPELIAEIDTGGRYDFGEVGYALSTMRSPSLATRAFIASLKKTTGQALNESHLAISPDPMAPLENKI